MLRKFAAAMVATALIAGPAFAQMPGNTPAAPAAQTTPKAPAAATTAAKPAAKPVKHATKHRRKHAQKHVRMLGKTRAVHQARHVKSGKAHQAGAASGKQS
jgi:hypothetical protein